MSSSVSHSITLGNADFNITGIVVFSLDPLNFIAENILVDYYSLYNVFYFPTSCNYPEAYLEGTSEIRNITGVTSKARTNSQSPSLLYNLGPGDAFIDSIDISNTYMDNSNPSAAIILFLYPN